MLKHFHSICWLGHLNSISTKRETNIFQATTMMGTWYLFSQSHLAHLIICHFASEDCKWGLKFNSELVTGGPGSASLTPWPVYFLMHQCFPKLNPAETRWDQIIWVHVHALVTPQRVTIPVNRENAQQNQMIKRLLKVYLFSFSFPIYSHKIVISCVSQETHLKNWCLCTTEHNLRNACLFLSWL